MRTTTSVQIEKEDLAWLNENFSEIKHASDRLKACINQVKEFWNISFQDEPERDESHD